MTLPVKAAHIEGPRPCMPASSPWGPHGDTQPCCAGHGGDPRDICSSPHCWSPSQDLPVSSLGWAWAGKHITQALSVCVESGWTGSLMQSDPKKDLSKLLWRAARGASWLCHWEDTLTAEPPGMDWKTVRDAETIPGRSPPQPMQEPLLSSPASPVSGTEREDHKGFLLQVHSLVDRGSSQFGTGCPHDPSHFLRHSYYGT